VADHTDRRRLLIGTQLLFAFQAAVFAALTLVHGGNHRPVITYWIVVALAVVGGVVQSFDLPARQSFLLDLVPKEDLSNAVALNSLAFNATRIIGPVLAGWFISLTTGLFPGRAALGEGVCFIVNTITYAAVLWSLFLIKIPALPRTEPTSNKRGLAAEGLRYIRERSHLMSLLIHLAFMALFGIPYLTLIPVFVKSAFHGNSAAYGNMLAAVGAGALVGGWIMASRRSVSGLGSHMIWANMGFAIACAGLGFCRSQLAGLLILGFVGFFMVMTMIASQTLAQIFVSEEVRGRVMSMYGMISIGFMPIGSLLSGYLAEKYDVRTAFLINATVCGLAGLYYALRLPKLRLSARASDEYQRHISAESAKK
jgi:MFS family permease